MKTISFINLKGGVGKTALAVNFAAYCGRSNYKTLLIDLDPQTNATFSSIGVRKWERHSRDKGTVANILKARAHADVKETVKTASDVIYKEAFHKVDLLPSHIDLFTVDLDLSGIISREWLLNKGLKTIIDDYDVIVCDCPPNLTLPTQNALAISDYYVIPVTLDFLSAIGISLLISRVNELSEDLDHKIENAGIILSRVGRPAQYREQTEATIRDQFKDDVLSYSIKERAAVSQCAQDNISVFDCPNEDAKDEFGGAFGEIFERVGLK